MVETDLGKMLDEHDWEVRPDFPKPYIAEFPFVDDQAFNYWQRIIRVDNINTQSAYDELGLEPSHEGETTESFVVEVKAIQKNDYYEIITKIRKACNTYHGEYANKIRLLDMITQRNVGSYYGKGLIELNKKGFAIYE